MKPWYQSKTLWAAAITGVIGVLGVVTAEQLVSSEAMAYLLIGVSILQGILRTMTSDAIYLR